MKPFNVKLEQLRWGAGIRREPTVKPRMITSGGVPLSASIKLSEALSMDSESVFVYTICG